MFLIQGIVLILMLKLHQLWPVGAYSSRLLSHFDTNPIIVDNVWYFPCFWYEDVLAYLVLFPVLSWALAFPPRILNFFWHSYTWCFTGRKSFDEISSPPPALFFLVRTERPEMFKEVRLLGTDRWHSLRWVWKGLPGKSISFLGLQKQQSQNRWHFLVIYWFPSMKKKKS